MGKRGGVREEGGVRREWGCKGGGRCWKGSVCGRREVVLRPCRSPETVARLLFHYCPISQTRLTCCVICITQVLD